MCTGIIVHTDNGVAVPARTMEFGFDVRSKILVIPKGTLLHFLSSQHDKHGYHVESAKYGFAGMNGVEKKAVFDGVNEAGLYFGLFYFAGFAVYDTLTDTNQSTAISSEEMGNYLLSSFATVDEVIAGLQKVTVVGSFIEDINGEAPVHYAVTDKSGKSIVVEYSKNGLQIFDNKHGVVCNNPTYDWHLTNLRNYVNLTPHNVTGFSAHGVEITPLAEGSGMLGLPGDYTSPSRFVRAAAFVQTMLPSKNEEEGVFRAFHCLNAFDIPKGAIRAKHDDQVFTDYTIWTSVVDTTNLIYYFKTYENQSPQKVDLREVLKKVNGKITTFETKSLQGYESIH